MIIELDCPHCQRAKIPLETGGLLSGIAFSCPHCNSKIELASHSVDTASQGLERFRRYQCGQQQLHQQASTPRVE